jgi:hypothetical protein
MFGIFKIFPMLHITFGAETGVSNRCVSKSGSAQNDANLCGSGFATLIIRHLLFKKKKLQ